MKELCEHQNIEKTKYNDTQGDGWHISYSSYHERITCKDCGKVLSERQIRYQEYDNS